MTGAELPVGIAIDIIRKAAGALYQRRRWESRLAKAVASEYDGKVSKRQLAKLLKKQELRTLLEQLDPSVTPSIATCISSTLTKRDRATTNRAHLHQQSIDVATILQRTFLKHLNIQDGMSLLMERLERRFDDIQEQLKPREDRISLPSICEERLKAIEQFSPRTSHQTRALLIDASLTNPESVRHIVVSPPDSLQDAPYQVWEVLADFLNAHQVSGSRHAIERAIALGTPRRLLHNLQHVITTYETGSVEQAQELVQEIESRDPVVDIVRARIDEDPDTLLSVIDLHDLDQSDDSDIALLVTWMKIWALVAQDKLNLAIEATTSATTRFPNRASLYLQQAQLKFTLAIQQERTSHTSDDLLSSTVQLALKGRNLFRRWRGPSGNAVVIAMRALLVMGQPERACELATQEPDGDANPIEARHPVVRTYRAMALLHLGRNEESMAVKLDDIASFDRMLLEAFQARNCDDPNAPGLMRQALNHAEDEASRMKALHGLALFGEVDESDLCVLSDPSGAGAVLIKAVNALQREEYHQAISLLRPYRSESASHMHSLADAQRLAGLTDEAITTLKQGASRFGDPSFYHDAVVLLVEANRLDDAETFANRALTIGMPERTTYGLRRMLVEIAERKKDWHTMEVYAQGLAQEYRDDQQAAWGVVFALIRQAKEQEAFSYLVSHNLSAIDHDSAVLEIWLRSNNDDSTNAIERILELAESNRSSEDIFGTALVSLVIRGRNLQFSEAQRTRIAQLTSEFIRDFPNSTIFGVIEARNKDEFVRVIEDQMAPGTVETLAVIDQVRIGAMPYGILQSIGRLHYAETLIGFKAGAISAVSPDPRVRSQECELAVAAIGKEVIVDTSVAVLHAELASDLTALEQLFHDVVVPSELLVDARRSASSLKEPLDATIYYDPAIQRVSGSEVDSESRLRESQIADDVLSVLSNWNTVSSDNRAWPFRDGPSQLAPWDAAIRLAHDRGCAIWADDVALRRLAGSVGVPAFGTYAACEAMSTTRSNNGLPTLKELKLDLLQHRVADVPITYGEFIDFIVEDVSVALPLAVVYSRPSIWVNPEATISSYRDVLKILYRSPSRDHAPDWLYHILIGAAVGMAIPQRMDVLSGILATTLRAFSGTELISMLVSASRAACHKIDPTGSLDIFDDAVVKLWQAMSSSLSPSDATQHILAIFSNAHPSDMTAAVSAILKHAGIAVSAYSVVRFHRHLKQKGFTSHCQTVSKLACSIPSSNPPMPAKKDATVGEMGR